MKFVEMSKGPIASTSQSSSLREAKRRSLARRQKTLLKNNSSGFVLILSLILLIFLGLMLEAASLRGNIELKESQNRLAVQQAFYAAESGLQQYVNQLRQSPGLIIPDQGNPGAMTYVPLYINNTSPTPLTVGFNKVAIKSTVPYEYFQSVWLKSWGQDVQQQVTVSILARVVVESPTSFFLSTAGNLHLASGTSINYDILGNNVYFDVNSSLPTPQNEISVQGNVFFLQGVTGNTNPAVSISGVTTQSPTETFSGVDTNYYQTIAQSGGSYTSGDLTYDGNISKAALNAPNGVVFATGNIYISGTVSDSMLFVAGGDVYINGDVTVPVSSTGVLPQNNSSAPQLGLLAGGDVIIPDAAPSDLTIDAFMMANGNPGSQGGILQAQGPKYSKGTINILGSVSLRGNDVTTAADLNVYTTRDYVYNTQFQTNLQIPFLPAISEIVNWQEVNPNDPMPS